MRILAVETSCDETAVAVLQLEDGIFQILHHQIASQIEQHRPFGGVVPELATRQHLLCLDGMVSHALAQESCSLGELDGFAVTRGPGLASALLVGLSYVKGLALAAGKPWIGVNHLEGHLYSPFLSLGVEPEFPHLGLIVSGGHTQLLAVRDLGDYVKLGSTLDDAAGEAFDKVGKMLGLPYPGGPQIEVLARNGDPQAYVLPRSMLDSKNLNFSFSGLKTSVRVLLEKRTGLVDNEQELADLCASFQAAVMDVLVYKARQAARENSLKKLTLSGGVSCNQALKKAMAQMAEIEGLEFLVASPILSTDNAAMIAAAGLLHLRAGHTSGYELDVDPNLRLCG
ncbi:MAG: tRNA (adenosine(37)-N6)-threonylcarbamoyltransferase complex transferase subunit TsaD [Blastochloris sp.]|nr:tRNA (adenosine(37)-N6)-threonylcarbamoyltransferase complex transferase subunit TsaD [Blastochloris sp.]